MGRSSKDKRDIHYRLAKEKGYRARSAFKLIHCDELYGLFDSGTRRVVDLCAAPGSWSQVVVERLLNLTSQTADLSALSPQERRRHERTPRLVSVDIQPIAPIHPTICTILKADITLPSTLRQISEALRGDDPSEDGGLADLVICDGAPDVTGMHDLDAHLQQQLLHAAMTMAACCLKPGGDFVAKVFVKPLEQPHRSYHIADDDDRPTRRAQAEAVDETLDRTVPLVSQFRVLFESATLYKPASSRAQSWEQFVVCQGYRPPAGFKPSLDGEFMVPADSVDAGPITASAAPIAQSSSIDGEVGAYRKWNCADFLSTGDLSAFDMPPKEAIRRASSSVNVHDTTHKMAMTSIS
ncbi:tRNA (uridine-2'-O-)-methyltransferase trm7 [Savitreella phatthalungensis]